MNNTFNITKKFIFLTLALSVTSFFLMSNRAEAAITGAFTASQTVENVVGVDNVDNPEMSVNAIAQVVTFTPGGTITQGETYQATINARNYTYLVSGGDTGATITVALKSLIDADPDVDCSEDGTKITCTANAAGTPFSFSSTVVDITAPTLTTVSIASNNSNNTTFSKAGDTVSLTFISNETINAPSVVFTSGGVAVHGGVVINNSSDNTWTASFVVASDDADGAVAYTINFNDSAGNSGAQVTTGSGGVTVDKTAPILSSAHISSSNSATTLAKTGDSINLSFTSNETVQSPVVTIAGHSAIVNSSGNNWTATYVMTVGDTEGVVPFVINFSDLAGNAGTAVTVVNDTSTVTFDKTAPTGNIVINSNATYTNSVNVSLSFSDVSSDVAQIQLRNGTVGAFQGAVAYETPHNFSLTNTNGTRTVSVRFIDSAGNQSVGVISDSIILDTTPPTATLSYSIFHAVKSGDLQTITATLSEPILDSPILQITISGSNTQTAVNMTKVDSTHYTHTHTVAVGEGTSSIILSLATDVAGNVVSSVPANGTFTVDNTIPVITKLGSDPDTFVYGSVYTDAGVTALDNVDGNATVSVVTTGMVGSTTAVGVYTVNYNLSDAAGNIAVGVTRAVNIIPKHITGSFTASDKVYDGSTSASVSSRSLVGVANNDAVSLSGGTATFNDKNVGSNKAVTLTGATLSGADIGNYILDSVATGTAAVTQKTITVAAVANTKTTDGNISASATPTIISGTLAFGDSPIFTETYENANIGTGKILIPSGSVSDGNSGRNYAVTFVNSANGIILSATQVVPNSNGEITVSSDKPEVVITNPMQAATVTISSNTNNPTLDLHSFITGGTGTLPAITIISANADNTKITISDSTTVTSADFSWSGIISAPTVTTVSLPVTFGETKKLSRAIEVGSSGTKLIFSNPVRLLFKGQAGKRAGYVSADIDFTEITDTCDFDAVNTTVNSGESLPDEGECKKNSANGEDLIIWTKHFTSFATYTQTKNPHSINIGGPAQIAGGFAISVADKTTSAIPSITVSAPIKNLTIAANKPTDSKPIASLPKNKNTEPTFAITPAPQKNSIVAVKNNPIIKNKSELKPETLSAGVINSAPAKDAEDTGFWGGVGKFFYNIFH